MRIQLKQTEVEEAINLWLGQQGINLADKSVTVSFSITRSPTSILADVDIDNVGTVVTAPRLVETDSATTDAEPETGPVSEAADAAPATGKSLFG